MPWVVASSSEPAGRTTVESVEGRQLAESLGRGVTAFAHEMFDFIAGEIEEIGSDPETVALTMASCVSTVETGLTMVRHGIPVERAEAPVAALEHARHMAARGISVDTTLRFYRLGHAFFWRWWIAALSEQMDDARQLAAALAETATFSFAYVDAVSAEVTAELLAERDRRERRITAMREDLVGEILSGKAVDPAAVQLTLGFSLERSFLAFLCRGEGAPASLESAAGALVAALGGERPLLLAHGADALIGWVHVAEGERIDPNALARVTGAAAPDVHVAIGSVASGQDGFRSSHEEAMSAQRVASLTGERAPSFTRFEDVALVDLLSTDLPSARALVRRELGALARADERSAPLREFLRTYLAASGNQTAVAAALGLHRNTVRQRLARSEELRGSPVTHHGSELLAALLLADALGASVLQAP